MAVIPGNLADRYLIQRHRNRSHAVLRQNQPEQPLKLIGAELFVPQYLHELIQHAAENFPQLSGLLRLLHPACLGLPVHPLRQNGL